MIFEKNFNQKILHTNILLSKELKDVINSIKLENYKINNNNFFKKDSSDEIKGKFIFSKLDNYFLKLCKYLKYKKYEVIDWWVQSYKEGQYHDLHTHGSDMDKYSFVLYFETTDNSSNITFYGPGYPLLTFNGISFKPKTGLLILFPCYLPHIVETNKDNKRLILSGNLKFIK